jgi:hypothetical protein
LSDPTIITKGAAGVRLFSDLGTFFLTFCPTVGLWRITAHRRASSRDRPKAEPGAAPAVAARWRGSGGMIGTFSYHDYTKGTPDSAYDIVINLIRMARSGSLLGSQAVTQQT